MPARDQGAKAGAELDHLANKSYQEYGYQLGEKVDRARGEMNEKLRDNQGKTPEDRFRELYGASASLVGNTYNYAWSWVPFTKRKAQEAEQGARDAQNYVLHHDASTMSKDAQNKGREVKERAENTELPGNTNQTLGGLINEARALAGQILDTSVYYIRVAEEKGEKAGQEIKQNNAKNAVESKANEAKSDSLINQARNLTAFFMEKASQIITYGQQKANEVGAEVGNGKNGTTAAAKNTSDSLKKQGESYADATKTNGTDGGETDRPHFAVSVQI